MPAKKLYATEEERLAARRASQRAWRARNPERQKAASTAWRLANPEYHGQYQKANPDRIAAIQNARRARRREGGDLTPEEWLEILDEFDRTCAYCQESGVKLELEHVVPLSRGGRHTRGNVVPACRSCNAAKGTMTALEFRMRAA